MPTFFMSFFCAVITLFVILPSPNGFTPKVENQLDMIKADIEVYKSLRKDGSAPKELADLTKPILEFDAKDGKFHNPVLVPERIGLYVNKNGELHTKYFDIKKIEYEPQADGSGQINYLSHSVKFHKTN